MHKIITILSIIGILITFSVWGLHSKDFGEMLMFSREKKPVIITETDDLFSTETTKTEWEEGFWLGLLPGDDSVSIDSLKAVVPISGFFVFIIIINYFYYFKLRRKK